MDLRQRVVLITGGARRIGRAIALRLANSGASIAVHYFTSEDAAQETAQECERLGVRAEVFQADLTDPAAPDDLVGRVLHTFGRLDVLVNNASAFEPMSIDAFDLAGWSRTLQVNLTAPMQLAAAARDALRAAGGRVVNLLDVATKRPWPDHLAYMASKGGLETLTQALSRAFAPEVNVVGVAPGVAGWPEHYSDEFRDRLTEKIPLKRPGAPEDVAAVVHFLLAEGDYLTGVIVPVDGGRHVV